MPTNWKAAAAAAGALMSNGGADLPNNHILSDDVPTPLFRADEQGRLPNDLPACPASTVTKKYHKEETCQVKPSRPPKGDDLRRPTYERLKQSGTGATLVPNQQTVSCPLDAPSLEVESSMQGFDTTWIVENTASTPVVIGWVVDGVEWSPFAPDQKPMDDPRAILQPGDWTSVPTFESFVYHVREVLTTNDGSNAGVAGPILLQHRAGLVPIGNPNNVACDASAKDVEPVRPQDGKTKPEVARVPTHNHRKCNTIDLGFRNQLGCPIHMYWANQLDGTSLPEEDGGFTCGERFRFHLGTKAATQDFMKDWESSTKFEGTFIGHTFVARLASDPNVIVDSYTLETTKVVDCPTRQTQSIVSGSKAKEAPTVAHAVVTAQGDAVVDGDEEPLDVPAVAQAAGLAVEHGSTTGSGA